jgi:hypothetical protein
LLDIAIRNLDGSPPNTQRPTALARENYFFLLEVRRRGTLAPERRASDKPIAIACLRLLTRLPDLPLRNFPRFISCIARLTLRDAVLPYLAMIDAPSVGNTNSLPKNNQVSCQCYR